MKKHLSLLTAGLLVLLFTACGDSIIEANDSPISTNASLRIQVLDQTSRNPLPGATVTLLSTGISQITDASGAVMFKDLRVGTYSYQVDRDGYASATQTLTVSNLAGSSSDIFVAGENSGAILIYPLNAGIQGALNYVDIDGKRLPANGATVRITISNAGTATVTGIVNSIFVTTVENGKYSFDSLPPVGTNYTIEALEMPFGRDTYRTFALTNLALIPNVISSQASVQEYAYANRVLPNFYITEYKRYVDTAASVVFKFSDAVDVDKSNVVISNNLVASIEWSPDKKTLTISPVVSTISTSWKNDFSVTLNPFKSVNGFDLAINPHTGTRVYPIALNIDLSSDIAIVKCDSINGIPELCNASNAPQDLAVNKIDISWPKVQGATSYNIFAKASAGDDYFIRVAVVDAVSHPSYTLFESALRSNLGVEQTKTPLGANVTQPFTKFTKTIPPVETPETVEFFVQPVRSVPDLYYAEGKMSEAATGKLTLSGAIPSTPVPPAP
jgi:hypothetical protein